MSQFELKTCHFFIGIKPVSVVSNTAAVVIKMILKLFKYCY